MSQHTKPAHEFRLGRIKTTIWANQAARGEAWFSVEITRLYLDRETWHESKSFSRDDLPLVAKAADMAFAWIWAQSPSAASKQRQRNAESNQPLVTD